VRQEKFSLPLPTKNKNSFLGQGQGYGKHWPEHNNMDPYFDDLLLEEESAGAALGGGGGGSGAKLTMDDATTESLAASLGCFSPEQLNLALTICHGENTFFDKLVQCTVEQNNDDGHHMISAKVLLYLVSRSLTGTCLYCRS